MKDNALKSMPHRAYFLQTKIGLVQCKKNTPGAVCFYASEYFKELQEQNILLQLKLKTMSVKP